MFTLRLKRSAGLSLVLALAFSAYSQESEQLIQYGGFEAKPDKIVARLKANSSEQQVSSLLSENNLTISRRIKSVPGLVILERVGSDAGDAAGQASAFTVSSLSTTLSSLLSSGGFEYAEPNYIKRPALEPDDSAYVDGTLWGLNNTGQGGGLEDIDINAPEAWDTSTGSKDVIVAVLDSGVLPTHIDLAEQMWINADEVPDNGIDDDNDGYVDNVIGVNIVSGVGDVNDQDGHGTHVAGTIGAAANDGNEHVGVMWDVSIMGIRAGNASFSHADLIAGFDFAIQNGAKVVNASFGGYAFSQGMYDIIEAAGINGVIIVAAAGNESNNNDGLPPYPTSYDLDNIISVAAIDRYGDLAGFSNYGRTTVDVGAPGVEIHSTYADSDTSYLVLQGTSMASPHVAGCVGLLFSVFPDATVDEIRTRLFESAVKLPSLEGITVTGGLVNIGGALDLEGDGNLEIGVQPLGGATLFAGQTVTFSVRVTDLVGISDATVTATVLETEETIEFTNDGVDPDLNAGDATYTGSYTVQDIGLDSINISFTATAPEKNEATRNLKYNIVVPAPNHLFADALKIPSNGYILPVRTTNQAPDPEEGEVDLANPESGEPNHDGIVTSHASLWFDWSPAVNSTTLIDTAGSSIDTVIGVYLGQSPDTLRHIASADFSFDNGVEAQLKFDAVAGETYRIAIAGRNAFEEGLIRLRVVPNGEPDSEAPVVSIGYPGSGLSLDVNTLIVNGTAFDPAVNSSGIRDILVQVNRDQPTYALGTTSWEIPVFLSVGLNTITVSAVDFANNVSEAVSVNVSYRPTVLPNDLFVNSILLTGNNSETPVMGNTELANKENQEANHGGNNGGKSVWYRWRAPQTGILTISTEGSSFDTLLGLYTGPSGEDAPPARVHNILPVAQNDDAEEGVTFSKIAQAIQARKVYYIAVDGFGGKSGDFQLSYSFEPSESVYNVTVNVADNMGGTVNLSGGLYAPGASLRLVATPDRNYRFDRWEGSFSSREPALDITVEDDLELTAYFQRIEVYDMFDSGEISAVLGWNTQVDGSDAPWNVVQVLAPSDFDSNVQENLADSSVVRGTDLNNSGFALRSGVIGNNQRSSIRLQAMSSGGVGSFSVKVNTELNWDKLSFYVYSQGSARPSTPASSWSGNVDWKQFEFVAPEGEIILEWVYAKDFGGAPNNDAVYIDNVNLPQIFNEPGTFSVSVSNVEGILALNIVSEGSTGQPLFTIESSSDLVEWTEFRSGVQLDESIEIDSSQPIQMFYRAIYQD